MQVELHNISKAFGRQTIFRNLDLSLQAGDRLAVLGGNGSGKSTLLKILYGSLTPGSGSLSFSVNGKPLPAADIHRYTALAAPYLELIEEFTLAETLDFYSSFKPWAPGLDSKAITGILQLRHAGQKPLMHFSSGMKQRVKLALAILSDAPLLLLDEPASNLDPEGIAWYRDLVSRYMDGRIVVVGSNHQQEEYFFAQRELVITDYS